MKLTIKLFLFLFILLMFQQTISAQNFETDTINEYLLEKGAKLLKPHSEMTFSFDSKELKNEIPDMSYENPNLNDTTRLLNEMKGNYNDWNKYYQIGKLYQKFNMNEKALLNYEKAYGLIINEIKKDSLNSEYYSEMGELYMGLNSQENARFFFEKAYNLNNNDSVACQFLPIFYLSSGKFDDLDKMIKTTIDNKNDNLSTYIFMVTAMLYKSIGQLNKSDNSLIEKPIDELFDFSGFNQVIEKHHEDVSFLVLNELSKEMAIFLKYLVLSDDFKKVEVNQKDIKELKLIRKKLQKLLSEHKFKNKHILYKALGFNFLLNKSYDKAVEMFEKSISAWPADENANDHYILFTTQYFVVNDTLAALNVLDNKIKSDSILHIENYADFVSKANIYLAQSDYTEAERMYMKSLKFMQNPDAYLGLAFLKVKNNKLREANILINKAYELNRNYYLTYVLFGIITYMNSQVEEAKASFEKALELNPDSNEISEMINALWPK